MTLAKTLDSNDKHTYVPVPPPVGIRSAVLDDDSVGLGSAAGSREDIRS